MSLRPTINETWRSLLRTRRTLTLAALALGVAVPVLALDAPNAGSALAPVVGCGYRFGPLIVRGAAGTLFYSVVLEPRSPAQQCSTGVKFTADISPSAATGPYTNIDNNPLTGTETVSFAPARRAPSLIVGWADTHCADPAVPGSLVITATNQRASAGVTPLSCGRPGAHSFLEPWSVAVLSAVGIAPTRTDAGYRTVETDGYMGQQGDATSFGATANSSAPAVGIQGVPNGNGVWVADSNGGVFSYGGARFYGSLGATHLGAPIVGMAAAPGGGGYWLVASDGGVFAFGDARFDGSLGAVLLNTPIVGMAAAPRGGYWLVASDGGVFAFGGVPFEGSMGGVRLDAPISGMAATSSGKGYWLVGSDNGVFAFGDARYFGSSPITP